MQAIRDGLFSIANEMHPLTVRGLFYQAVSRGLIEKTEAGYTTVQTQSVKMRRESELPYGWIADATRWQRKPATYSSAEAMLERTARTYRQAIWEDQDAYVEVWLEKDALAGVVYQVTSQWDVPLMVTRGYPSLSYLFDAAETLKAEEGRPCFLYYLGDHDPSGLDIPRKVERDLRVFSPDVDLTFERIAVTMDQVERWSLQTRPTKGADTRARHFEGNSIEVDAIPPDQLRDLVWDAITRHIDADILERTRRIEAAERETLQGIIDRLEEEAT
jgi:hypothetical protein